MRFFDTLIKKEDEIKQPVPGSLSAIVKEPHPELGNIAEKFANARKSIGTTVLNAQNLQKIEPVLEIPKTEANLEPVVAQPLPEKPLPETTEYKVFPIQESTTENNSINAPTDRKFVYEIISEIGNLLTLGRQFESLQIDKKIFDERTEEQLKTAQETKNKANEVGKSIENLKTENDKEKSVTELENVLKAFQNYIDSLESNLKNLEEKTKNEGNTLISKLNSKKAEISKMLSIVNGQENFDLIKKFIKRAESKRPEYLKKNKVTSEVHSKEISEKTIEARINSSQEFKKFTENGDMVSILCLIYNQN